MVDVSVNPVANRGELITGCLFLVWDLGCEVMPLPTGHIQYPGRLIKHITQTHTHRELRTENRELLFRFSTGLLYK